MSDPNEKRGTIVWHDLTVPQAAAVRDFYAGVIGWNATPQSMGEYDDYNMSTPEGVCVAGVCHRRGPNANLPPQWLMYVSVADVDESATRCKELGGSVIDGPRTMGQHRFCVIQDPAGAVLALISA